jgi:hypothetical protein
MEPMDSTARAAHKAGCIAVGPVKVEQRHSRGLKLPPVTFEELVLARVTTQILAMGKRDGLWLIHADYASQFTGRLVAAS